MTVFTSCYLNIFHSKLLVFNWEKEAKDLASIVPVMKSFKNNSLKREQTVIRTASPIDDNLALRRVIEILKVEPIISQESGQVVKAIDEGQILGCQELSLLDDIHSFPRLKQTFSGGFFQKGGLDLDAKRSHDVTTFTHQRAGDVTLPRAPMDDLWATDPPQTEAEERFSSAVEELEKLTWMRKWPGIPRLYAACLRSRDGSDVTALDGDLAHLSVHSVR